MNTITIKLTEKSDLLNVQQLWADPEVMKFVGFPEGLHETPEHLGNNWLPWVQNPPKRQHYSVYEGNTYCGESFYDVDETGLACMDIKLLPEARGKSIAFQALAHALTEAFAVGGAERAYVDPDPENAKALALYRRLHFRETERPAHLEDPGCPYVYMELHRNDWDGQHKEIHYRDIVLRDMVESDIADWVRWQTVQTEWMDWDGPDLESDPFDEQAFRAECDEQLKSPMTVFRSFFELATKDGKHIGMVSSYATDENFQHLSWAQAHSADQFWFTLGICICESGDWSKGLGTQALAAFCKHFLDHGKENLRLQTWSGNVRMVRCAERIGFRECNRFVGNRHIRGGVYDGLTFQLDEAAFWAYLAENP